MGEDLLEFLQGYKQLIHKAHTAFGMAVSLLCNQVFLSLDFIVLFCLFVQFSISISITISTLASNVQEKHAQLNLAQIISDHEPFFIALLLRGHEPKHNSSRLDILGRDVEESELSQPVWGLEDALSQTDSMDSNGIKFQNKF